MHTGMMPIAPSGTESRVNSPVPGSFIGQRFGACGVQPLSLLHGSQAMDGKPLYRVSMNANKRRMDHGKLGDTTWVCEDRVAVMKQWTREGDLRDLEPLQATSHFRYSNAGEPAGGILIQRSCKP